MEHSVDCTRFVASFEGFRSTAYQDQGGIWTLGYGTTKNVHEGDTCTEIEAESWLSRDLLIADEAIRKYAPVPLGQHQWDALCSLIYNIGASQFDHSTILDCLIRSDYDAAAAAWIAPKTIFNKVNGKVSSGLTKRRMAERLIFLTPE